jgi:transcriptional regulator with AAA-type ATPase domain
MPVAKHVQKSTKCQTADSNHMTSTVCGYNHSILHNGEIFYSIKEVQVLAERWRLPNFSSADVAAAPEMISKAASPALWLDGSSAAMNQLRGQIRRVAPYFRSALFVGEPGCGQEAAAQTLHQLSPLSQRPFLSIESSEGLSLFGGARSEEALASVGMFYISRPDRLPPLAQTTLLRLVRRYGPQAPRITSSTF